jgi:hypothetical protein
LVDEEDLVSGEEVEGRRLERWEEGRGEARGVPWALLGAERERREAEVPLVDGFLCGVGAISVLTLRTSVLILNLDFWLNMLIFPAVPNKALLRDWVGGVLRESWLAGG